MEALKLISQIVFALVTGLIGGALAMWVLNILTFGIMVKFGIVFLNSVYVFLVICISGSLIADQMDNDKIGF